MFPLTLENFIKVIKSKYNQPCVGKNIIVKHQINKFLFEYINTQGNLIITQNIIEELEKLILLCIDHFDFSSNQHYEFLNKDDLKKNASDYFSNFKIYSLNDKVFYKNFFEKIGTSLSALIIQNIYYDILAKIVFQIYLYLGAPYSFEEYFSLNDKLFYDSYEKIKIMSDYILYESDLFNDQGFTSTSYRLLFLGHLMKRDLKNENNETFENIFLENVDFAFGRVALELFKNTANDDHSKLLECFEMIKSNYIAPSTPIFYNSLTKHNLLTSCFVIDIEDNTLSIGKFFKKLACIQKFNSGIGVNFGKIRAKNRSVLDGNATSNGITNFINVVASLSENFRNVKKHRSCNVNITLSIDHPDIIEFIKLKTANLRKEDGNYKNVFMTVSIPDEFFYRVLNDQIWYFISPDITYQGRYLHETFGEEYSHLYNLMVNDPLIPKTEIKANVLMSEIVNVMIQTGSPFIFFRDTINYTTNHKHHGIIQSTNLCTEILEYFDEEKTACCNLTSINLKKFIKIENNKKIFDFKKLEQVTANVVYYLNNSINNTLYSHKSCKKSNLETRPMGIGVQGLCNLFYELDLPYEEGSILYRQISETLYYSALKASNDLAINKMFPIYDEECKSPFRNQKLSFDLYKDCLLKRKEYLANILKKENIANKIDLSILKPIMNYDWNALKDSIQEHGTVNSLVLAFMPTSLSSGIYNNIESVEAMTYNIQKRMFSNFDVIDYNTYLVNYLLKKKFFDHSTVLLELNKVEGNINKLNIPEEDRFYLNNLYKTVYNIDNEKYLQVINSNNHLIDQGKSTNIYVSDNNQTNIIKSIIVHWISGTKTLYYYRTQIDVNPTTLDNFNKKDEIISNNMLFKKKKERISNSVINKNNESQDTKNSLNMNLECKLRKTKDGICYECSS